MKAILVIEMPDIPKNCMSCPLIEYHHEYSIVCRHYQTGDIRPSWCPLKHPLKSVDNDFYIYDRKYLFDNLEREIELLRSTKRFEEYMRSKDESNISG